jgi:hypothetical protein
MNRLSWLILMAFRITPFLSLLLSLGRDNLLYPRRRFGCVSVAGIGQMSTRNGE